MHPEDDQRLTPRNIFDQPIQLERSRFFIEQDTQVFEIGQTIDISLQGIGIKTEAPLHPKEMVRVYLPVQAMGIPLPVFSEVKWVRFDNHFYRTGLQFVR